MKKKTTLTIAAMFCAATASHAADLYLDTNGTDPGFGVDSTVSPIEVNFTNLIWNTDSTGGAGGTITTVSDGDILHFGLEGSAAILFNFTYFTNVTVGGIHTYQTEGSTAGINRFQVPGNLGYPYMQLRWAPGATFETTKACGLFWNLGTVGDFEKIGTQWLTFDDGGLKLNGTCTITTNNVIVRNLGTVSSASSFNLNGGQLRFKGGLTGTANIGTLSGSGKVDRDSTGDLSGLTINTKGIDMVNGSAGDQIAFDRGPDVVLAPDAVTSLEINKSGGTNYADTVKLWWAQSDTTYDGTLDVTLLGGSEALAAGDTFQLFEKNASASFLGSFNSIDLPELGDPGLIWSMAGLTASGVIEVVVADASAPSIPIGLTAVSNVYTVSLDWNDNPEPTVTGYKVYRSDVSGSGFVEIADVSVSEYLDTTTVPSDNTYHYHVKAYNFADVESDPSEEASTTVLFNLRNGDFELPAIVSGGTTISNSGDWAQNGDVHRIQKSGWAAEDGEQGVWLRGWNLNVTNAFWQDKSAASGIEYTLDAGFKVGQAFRTNGGQVEMALVWLDGGSAEISRDSINILDAISTDGAFAHTNITAIAPSGTSFVRSEIYWTTTTNANNDVAGDKSSMVDNITLTRNSAPNPYDVWAGSWGVNIGGPNDDFVDNDGMENLLEYALDGDPTADDAASKLPVFTVAEDAGSDWFYYVHNERTDDSTLTYTVKRNDNLVHGSWTNNGIAFVGESSVSNNFKSVTNRTDIGSVEYLRLEVERD